MFMEALLTRTGATNRVGYAYAVDANLVDCLVDGEEVDEVRAEGVFSREADLNTPRFDEVNHFDGCVLDV